METTITPETFERKISKAGKDYWTITAQGVRYTLHEPSLAMNFQIGKTVTIEFTESGDWKNIKAVKPAVQTEQVVQTVMPNQQITEARAAKDTSIYTSYAKDLCIAGKTMEEAINLVKQAKQAFS